jgi:hypothetical protein
MFFIIHGNYASQNDLGVVADRCGHCGNLRVHRVTEHRRIGHLYFVPLGRGEVVAATITCTACNGVHEWRPERYTGYIPEAKARALTLGQILWKTNPAVADTVATRMRLERDAAAWQPGRDAGPDPRVALAFAKLADIHEDDSIQQRSLLERWNTLDAYSQERVLRDVDGLAEGNRHARDRARFVRAAAHKFTPGDHTAKYCVFGAVAFLCCPLGFVGLEPSGLGALGIVCGLAIALAAAWLFHWWYTRHVYRRYFRRQFLPEAERRGVPVAEVVETLGCIDPRDKQVDEHLRDLACGLPVLNQVLAEQEHQPG